MPVLLFPPRPPQMSYCPACKGEGRLTETQDEFDRETGWSVGERDAGECPYCNGFGIGCFSGDEVVPVPAAVTAKPGHHIEWLAVVSMLFLVAFWAAFVLIMKAML